MNLKKFFTLVIFSGALLFSFNAGTSWASVLVTIKNSPAEISYDVTVETTDAGDVIVHRLTTDTSYVYEFETLIDALNFANDPVTYYAGGASFDFDNTSYFSDIAITFEKSDALSEDIDFTSTGYTTLQTISFSGAYTLTSAANKRHFVISNSGMSLTFNNLTFAGNSGGGFQITYGGTTNFSGVTFQNIDARYNSDSSQQNGGAIYSGSSGGAINFSGTNTFTGNVAANGGVFYMDGGTVTFASGGTNTFTGNTAQDSTATAGNGGVFYVASGTLSLAGTNTFGTSASYNSALTSGGAFYVAGGTVNFTGTETFTSNIASGDGGAVYTSGGNLTFSATNQFVTNQANNGGAIYAGGSSAVTFSYPPVFSSNLAKTSGGGLYIAGATATITGPSSMTSGYSFTGNQATNGGAIYLASGTATLTGAISFTSNLVSGDGGAVYIAAGSFTNSSATLEFVTNYAGYGTYNASTTDPTIGDNLPTVGRGGAIHVAGGTTTFGSIAFENNSGTLGGAVYSTGGSTRITFNSSAVFGLADTTYHNAAYRGGALYIDSGTVNFATSASFENNTAHDHGGAVCVTSNGSLNFTTSADFKKNVGNSDSYNFGDGGGIYWAGTGSSLKTALTTSGTVAFTNNYTYGTSSTTAETNYAAKGGGIFFAGSDTFTIDSSTNITFTGNTVYNSGGAIGTNSGDITFTDVTFSDTNTATNGRGGLVYSKGGTFTASNVIISNQKGEEGGAVYALNISVTSSDFAANSTTSSSTGGGALFTPANGTLTVSKASFTSNSAAKSGGAIFAATSTVTITDSYFYNNTAPQDGGALDLEGSTTVLTNNTFNSNQAKYGGAIRIFGTIQISLSYFLGNHSSMNGGAIYFSQYGTGNGVLSIKSSTLQENIADGGQGGGLFLEADRVTIDSCTFNGNSAIGGTDARGGGVYLDVSQSASTLENLIENCTFYLNQVNSGSSSSSGGGLSSAGTVKLRSSTFVKNTAVSYGGGVFVASGPIEISGTIIVGNNAPSDIYAQTNSSITSLGYNRIGIYETVNGQTGWLSGPGNTNRDVNNHVLDASDTSWTMATFYSGNVLDDNIVSTAIPPYIGSTRYSEGQIRLQTIMLSEDAALAEGSRATNIIPWGRRFSFPALDQRGADRRANGGALDIGPVFFDGTGPYVPPSPISSYSIARILMSGVPNEMRRIGQTASLIAKIYYTNGRSAYGGTGTGEEPVTWASDKPSYISVGANNGVITALRATTGETYVTISVSTVRTNAAGNVVSASKRVKVTSDLAYSDLNTSPQAPTADVNVLVRELRQNFSEYNIGYGFLSTSSEDVSSAYFQSAFTSVWGTSAANLISRAAASPEYNFTSTATTAGVNINLSGRSAGDIYPIIFPWEFSGTELEAALGTEIYNSILSDLTYSQVNSMPLSFMTAQKIFSVMKVEFEGVNNSWIILGPGGSVNVADALNSGALVLKPADSGHGVLMELTAYIANVTASGVNSSVVSGSSYDGPQLVQSSNKKLLVVPDGLADNLISGTMWISDSNGNATGSLSQTTSSGSSSYGSSSGGSNNNSSSSSGGSSDGGGGGCSVMSLGLLAAAIIIFKRR